MKTLGLLLLFGSTSFSGFLIANNFVSYLKDIKRIEDFIKNIILCLKKENMTLMKIFETCSNLSDSKTKDFIKTISPKDFDKIHFMAKESGFCKNKSALLILQEAFSVLGKYSLSEQISELEFCRKKANELYSKSEKDLLSKAKIFKSSGILAGTFLVIIFI